MMPLSEDPRRSSDPTIQLALKHFPGFDYNAPSEDSICLVPFSRPDNITGLQQFSFGQFWSTRLLGSTGLTGLDVGSGGIRYPYCISSDIKLSSGVQITFDATDIPFEDESFHLILAIHVIEHIKAPIKGVLEHWLTKVDYGGVVAIIAPDDKHNDVLAMEAGHCHATNSDSFAKRYTTDLNADLIEYNTLNNQFSFNVVLKRK